MTAEFPGGANSELVARWIEREAAAVAFSSHTAELPLPRLAEVKIIPIVMLRHPLDRIRSAYQFERKQKSESLGAKLAKTTDLAGYIRARLDMTSDRQCRNFHASRLVRMTASQQGGEFEAAAGAVRELPFVGVVEAFDRSMDSLRELLTPDFPSSRLRASARTSLPMTASAWPSGLTRCGGTSAMACGKELNTANETDLRLHHLACVRLLGEGGLPDAPPPLTSVTPKIQLPPSRPAGPQSDVEDLLKRGQRDTARQRLRAIVESLPTPLPVAELRRLAPLFFRAEAACDVITFIAALREADKASDAVQMTLARALNLAGRPGEAETAYRRILAQTPDHAAAHRMLGLLLFSVDRLTDALPHLKRTAET